jgi:hypothetical protein
MAYYVNQSVYGEIKIISGYEKCFYAKVMTENGGGVVQKTENIKTMKTVTDEI